MDLNVSSWSEPDFGWRWKPCIELVVEVAQPLVVVLVPALVVGEGSVSPPSVQQEAEEERIDEAGIKAVSMSVEDTVSLEGTCCPPESAVRWEVSGLRNQS